MRVAVMTSGGDAPGMNAAIRAIVRGALEKGWTPVGVLKGYAGLIGHQFRELGDRDVGGIIQRGGTMLGSARTQELLTEPGQRRALEGLEAGRIDALAAGRHGVLVGMTCGAISETPLGDVAGRIKPIDPTLWELARVLAR